ncbi:MAG TPA: c-type cytochrome [Caldimonas sp.]|nr:c-type cytochrome [Caldimonas sp.]
MSDAHESNEIDGPHEGPIKTPRQLILAVFYAFVVPIFGIILLVMYVTAEQRPSAGSDALGPKAVEERIRPVGHVEIKDAADLASMKTGEQVFAAQCTTCHTAGLLGSPKFGDAAAWAPRIKTGYDALLHSALAGKGQMPPQGGGDFSDLEIGRAVVFMANKAGGKLAEPAAPPPAASGATAVAGAAAPAATAPADAQAKSAPTPAAPTPAPATTVAAPPAKGDAAATPALFMQICAVCHAQGVAGAPKLGDKAAWAPRVAQGIDALTASVIKGKGAMPPKGGSTASDAEIKTVVTYMVNAAK